MYKEILGIVGGFGAYATLNFYKRILEVFASESERNYPHIIMDNNFTMPSRTRGLLYDECYEEIVHAISDSIRNLISLGANRIVMVCGTAHYFLKDVYCEVPEAKEYIVDIIDVLGDEMQCKRQSDALVIAAEGTLLKELYPKRLEKFGISCNSPCEDMYQEIRYFIESVKKNSIDDVVVEKFKFFLQQYQTKNVILGCTEFPVLVEYIAKKVEVDENYQWIREYTFWDPLEITIKKLKKEMC